MSTDCPRHCYEHIECMIKGLVSKLSGEVESIYFQEDADYNTNLRNGNSNEPLKHRFLLSFTALCHRTQMDRSDQAEVFQTVTDESGSINGDNLSQHTQKMRDQLMNNTRESEIISVRMMQVEMEKVGKNVEALTSLEGGECIKLTNLHRNHAPLSNFSSEELHATTDHQLSKKKPTLKQMECGNQLLENPNYISSRTDKNKLSPQQQSSDTFSSSGTFHLVRPTSDGRVSPTSASGTCTEKNDTQECVTHVTIPYTELLQHQPENHDPMKIIIAGTEIFLQEGVAPAQLPAVSSLFSTRSYSSVSMSSVENKPAPVQQVVRVVKQFPTQSHTSDCRPALLRPKHRSVSMTNAEASEATMLIPKIRPRKRFAVKNNNHPVVVKPHSQSMFLDVPSNAPKGTTLESWILEEGLYKVLKEGSHKPGEKASYPWPYVCPACHKGCKSVSGIKYHAKYAHGPKRCLVCDICKKEYSSTFGLDYHTRSHKQKFVPPRA